MVYGLEGLDEISITGPTRIAELRDGKITSYSISPDQFGISLAPRSAIAGGTPAENAAIIRDVLKGQKGPHRDVVLLNAGFAITAAGLCKDPAEGISLAQRVHRQRCGAAKARTTHRDNISRKIKSHLKRWNARLEPRICCMALNAGFPVFKSFSARVTSCHLVP